MNWPAFYHRDRVLSKGGLRPTPMARRTPTAKPTNLPAPSTGRHGAATSIDTSARRQRRSACPCQPASRLIDPATKHRPVNRTGACAPTSQPRRRDPAVQPRRLTPAPHASADARAHANPPDDKSTRLQNNARSTGLTTVSPRASPFQRALFCGRGTSHLHLTHMQVFPGVLTRAHRPPSPVDGTPRRSHVD